MSDADHSPRSSTAAAQPRTGTTRPGPGRRRSVWMAGAVAVGMALGAGGFAIAATVPGNAGWHHGPSLEHIQRFVVVALDSVGATTAQEGKIHDIVAATFADMGDHAKDRNALRGRVLGLLRAPTIDRAAAEAMRVEQITALDTRSKKIVGAVLDAAEQLTPEQRAKLADRAEQIAQHGPMGALWGGRPGGMGGRWHGPMDGEHGAADIPDLGPDNVPDRG